MAKLTPLQIRDLVAPYVAPLTAEVLAAWYGGARPSAAGDIALMGWDPFATVTIGDLVPNGPSVTAAIAELKAQAPEGVYAAVFSGAYEKQAHEVAAEPTATEAAEQAASAVVEGASSVVSAVGTPFKWIVAALVAVAVIVALK